MDVLYFLKKRTTFLRGFYDAGISGFRDTQRRIEALEPPFDNPPWIEDEPPFMPEWSDAQTGTDLVGQASVSVLSDTLKLYFNTLQKRVIGFVFDEAEKRRLKKDGFVQVYRDVLGEILGTDWSDCPANFDAIEDVVLARNLSQHGEHLSSFHVAHTPHSLREGVPPIFANQTEWQSWIESGGGKSFLMPSVEITREALFRAIDEIERLADWIETQLPKAAAWRERQEEARARE